MLHVRSARSFSPSEFLEQVIRPALQAIDLDSLAAEQLLLATALQESDLRNTVQMGGGPALGYFQMEPATHDDIWANFLRYRGALAGKVRALAGHGRRAFRRRRCWPAITAMRPR